jgi:uncharacterized membrane protein YwzB
VVVVIGMAQDLTVFLVVLVAVVLWALHRVIQHQAERLPKVTQAEQLVMETLAVVDLD